VGQYLASIHLKQRGSDERKKSVEIAAQFCGERLILRGIREILYQTASAARGEFPHGLNSCEKLRKADPAPTKVES
jgi:hypothetical protein